MRPEQEEDRLRANVIWLALGVTLAVTLVCIGISWLILRTTPSPGTEPQRPLPELLESRGMTG